jgi:hypothetical protein
MVPERIAVATVLGLLCGCNIDVPDLGGGDGGIDVECSQFSDLLLSYTPADGTGISTAGERAVGPPDGESVLLDPDAVLILGFIGLGGVVDEEGDDIRIHGEVSPDTLVNAYVSTETDPDSFRYAGDLGDQVLDIDLATASSSVAIYLRLVGIEGALQVDAVEALQTTCPGQPGS